MKVRPSVRVRARVRVRALLLARGRVLLFSTFLAASLRAWLGLGLEVGVG